MQEFLSRQYDLIQRERENLLGIHGRQRGGVGVGGGGYNNGASGEAGRGQSYWSASAVRQGGPGRGATIMAQVERPAGVNPTGQRAL